MISKQSRTKEWIMGIRRIATGRDPILIEKMILALTLIENLRLSGLNFIFKGGTSLTLILGKPERFSIDIDIVLASQQNLDPFSRQSLIKAPFIAMRKISAKGIYPNSITSSFFTQ